MSVQEKKDKLKLSIELLTDAELELIERLLEKIHQDSNDDVLLDKFYADVKAQYGEVLLKLAQ